MTAQSMSGARFPLMGALQRKRLFMWLMLSVLAALVGYFGFRGYLTPELLFHFANSLYC
jgi:cytochrome c oxidase subunit IV